VTLYWRVYTRLFPTFPHVRRRPLESQAISLIAGFPFFHSFPFSDLSDVSVSRRPPPPPMVAQHFRYSFRALIYTQIPGEFHQCVFLRVRFTWPPHHQGRDLFKLEPSLGSPHTDHVARQESATLVFPPSLIPIKLSSAPLETASSTFFAEFSLLLLSG